MGVFWCPFQRYFQYDFLQEAFPAGPLSQLQRLVTCLPTCIPTITSPCPALLVLLEFSVCLSSSPAMCALVSRVLAFPASVLGARGRCAGVEPTVAACCRLAQNRAARSYRSFEGQLRAGDCRAQEPRAWALVSHLSSPRRRWVTLKPPSSHL